MESSKDNDEDSEGNKMDWGLIFSILKNKGFSHEEILNLSYPTFNAYMNNINNPLSYNIFIPYLGGGEDEENNKNEKTYKVSEGSQVGSKEELMGIIASMNSDFSM